MPAHYTKERAKYGSGVGSIITWPVELTTKDPLAESNVKYLPAGYLKCCLLYTSPSPRDATLSRMPSSA